MARGSLCISIDLELAWGIWDKPSAEYFARCEAHERRIVSELVAMFDAHEVQATWAIVARLLDPSPDRAGVIWYAPDLIERVQGARVPQEIGSHGYAHVYFGEASRDQLRADLEAARRIHLKHGLRFESFVFPRNQVDHLDLLREAGIRVFRSIDRGWQMTVRQRLGTTAGRLANLVDKALPIPPAVVTPIDHDGLIELPSSMLLLARNGVRRVIHPHSVVAKAAAGIERARRRGEIFHLWFHPSNFYYDTDLQLETLARILRRACAVRDRNELDIQPMEAFARAA